MRPANLLYTTQPSANLGTHLRLLHTALLVCVAFLCFCLLVLLLILCSMLYPALADAMGSITCFLTIASTTTILITADSDISPCVQEAEQDAPAVLLPMLTLEDSLMKCASNATWWARGMLAYAAPFPGMHFLKVLNVSTGQCIILADSCWLLPGEPSFLSAAFAHSFIISLLLSVF